MPELPDLDILADAFTAALAGRMVSGHAISQPLVMRGTTRELAAFHGHVLDRVERRGKFLTLHFEDDRLVFNAMLTGRLGLGRTESRALPQTAFVLAFGPRRAPPRSPAPWTIGATWLPPDGEGVVLRYRDAARMGKVYVLPRGIERPVAGWAEQGPDVDDAALDIVSWRTRIGRHSGELKGLLKDQTFVAGIGNSYSDEILWSARLAPFRKRATLADEEVERLWQATREVPPWAIAILRERVPPRFEIEVRDFLRVHRRGGEPCQRCGASLSQVSPGGFVTTWCRSCQR